MRGYDVPWLGETVVSVGGYATTVLGQQRRCNIQLFCRVLAVVLTHPPFVH